MIQIRQVFSLVGFFFSFAANLTFFVGRELYNEEQSSTEKGGGGDDGGLH